MDRFSSGACDSSLMLADLRRVVSLSIAEVFERRLATLRGSNERRRVVALDSIGDWLAASGVMVEEAADVAGVENVVESYSLSSSS